MSLADPLVLGACKIVELSATKYEAVWDTGELVDITDPGPRSDVSSWYSPMLGPGSVEGLLTSSDHPDAWRVDDAASLFDPAVPEPATLTLLGIGLVGLGITRCRRTAPDSH